MNIAPRAHEAYDHAQIGCSLLLQLDRQVNASIGDRLRLVRLREASIDLEIPSINVASQPVIGTEPEVKRLFRLSRIMLHDLVDYASQRLEGHILRGGERSWFVVMVLGPRESIATVAVLRICQNRVPIRENFRNTSVDFLLCDFQLVRVRQVVREKYVEIFQEHVIVVVQA